ncbi:hypothetical protein AALF16_23715 [Bacillus cereus]|uniref:hypothetical protein n=1 Tax=Bacillus cereus TaxID=1396 RepID=UPI00356F8DAF
MVLRRNICFLLIFLMMLISCVIFPFVQPSTIHATTNQEQTSEIKYVNKNLGFSLVIPASWKDKYLIREEGNGVSFVLRYNNQTYEGITFFTISYGPAKEEGWEKELRGVRTLGRKGNMMYSSYTSFNMLDVNESTQDQAIRDIALSMAGQIDTILDSLQVIKPTGDSVKSGKDKKVMYRNDTHKFSLVLPEVWKENYSIDEFVENIAAHTTKIEFYFTRKTDGYREPIFMIYIYDEKLYSSDAEGESSIPAHILGKGYGKIYEIVTNDALQNYDRYDELFLNATKEEQKIIANMSKQVKDIAASFKMLEERKVAEDEKGDRGKRAEIKYIPMRQLPSNIEKTTVVPEYVIHALRNYPDSNFPSPVKTYYSFMDEFHYKHKMPPGTILISPESIILKYRYGHAAIIGPDGTVIEAPGPGKKVRKKSLSEFIKEHPFYIAYLVDGATKEQALSAAKYAEEQIDKPYITNLFIVAKREKDREWMDTLFGGGFAKGKYWESAFYCSSLIWRAWFEQGFDIDYNDDEPTPTDRDGSMMELFATLNIAVPNEEFKTVFPAELLRDPLLVPIWVSEDLRGQDLEPEEAEFKNKLTTFLLKPGVSEYDIDVWQSQGHIYKLDVYENKSNAPVEIKIVKDKLLGLIEEELYVYKLAPGELLKDVYIPSPVGNHSLVITGLETENGDDPDYNLKGSMISIIKK